MDEKIVSACVGCWNENGDKNKCSVKCDKRIKPVLKIGPMVSSMEPFVEPMEKPKPSEAEISTISPKQASPCELSSVHSVIDESTPKDLKNNTSRISASKMINSICLDHGINRDMLYSKHASKKILMPLRVKLAQALKAEGLKLKEIAHLIGCPKGSVYSYLSKNTDPKQKTRDKAENYAMNGRTEYEHVTKKMQGKNNIITIDFKDHPDLYKDLLELSKERLRSPEQQILWILLKIHEKGMESVAE